MDGYNHLNYEQIDPEITCCVFSGFVIIIMKESTYGCMNCVMKRMKDNRHDAFDDKKNVNRPLTPMDQEIIRTVSKAVKDGGGKYYYSYDLFKQQYQKRRMIPYPQCPCCIDSENVDTEASLRIESDDELILWGNYRKKSFDELIEVIEKCKSDMIDPTFGLFKGLYRGVADCMPLISVDCKLGNRTYDAYGRSSTYKLSYYVAVLEALERYHGVYPYYKSNFYSSEDSLKNEGIEFVSLNNYIHYTEDEYHNPNFEMDRYDGCKKIYWRYVYSCRNKRYLLAPEQNYYFSNEQVYPDDSEKRYLYDSSNGTALGSTFEESVISAMFELIERDAFMVHWYTKSSPVRLLGIENIDDLDIRMMLAYLHYYSYEVHVFDITLETKIPSIWVLLENTANIDDGKFSFYTAAGANTNPIQALRSALVEAATAVKVFARFASERYTKEQLIAMRENYEEIKKLEDHLYLYSSSCMKKEFEFALESGRECEFNSQYEDSMKKINEKTTQKKMMDDILGRVLEFHEDVYIRNLTSPYLKKMGLNCTKVSVPTMHNISFGYQYRNINKARLSQALEINDLDGSLSQMCIAPHPFP